MDVWFRPSSVIKHSWKIPIKNKGAVNELWLKQMGKNIFKYHTKSYWKWPSRNSGFTQLENCDFPVRYVKLPGRVSLNARFQVLGNSINYSEWWFSSKPYWFPKGVCSLCKNMVIIFVFIPLFDIPHIPLISFQEQPGSLIPSWIPVWYSGTRLNWEEHPSRKINIHGRQIGVFKHKTVDFRPTKNGEKWPQWIPQCPAPFFWRNINCSSGSCASTERDFSKTSTAATPILVKARLWTPWSGKTVGKRQRAIKIHFFADAHGSKTLFFLFPHQMAGECMCVLPSNYFKHISFDSSPDSPEILCPSGT